MLLCDIYALENRYTIESRYKVMSLHNILRSLGVGASALYLWRKPASLYEVSPGRLLRTVLVNACATLGAALLAGIAAHSRGTAAQETESEKKEAEARIMSPKEWLLSTGIRSFSLIIVENVGIAVGSYTVPPTILLVAAHMVYARLRGLDIEIGLAHFIIDAANLTSTRNYTELLLAPLLSLPTILRVILPLLHRVQQLDMTTLRGKLISSGILKGVFSAPLLLLYFASHPSAVQELTVTGVASDLGILFAYLGCQLCYTLLKNRLDIEVSAAESLEDPALEKAFDDSHAALVEGSMLQEPPKSMAEEMEEYRQNRLPAYYWITAAMEEIISVPVYTDVYQSWMSAIPGGWLLLKLLPSLAFGTAHIPGRNIWAIFPYTVLQYVRLSMENSIISMMVSHFMYDALLDFIP